MLTVGATGRGRMTDGAGVRASLAGAVVTGGTLGVGLVGSAGRCAVLPARFTAGV